MSFSMISFVENIVMSFGTSCVSTIALNHLTIIATFTISEL